jgi:hypothetical protein
MTPPEALNNISITTGEKDKLSDYRLEDEQGRKFIKVHFPTNAPPGQPQFERMWVRVKDFDKRDGILDTDPIDVQYIKFGQKVFFDYDETTKRYEFKKTW